MKIWSTSWRAYRVCTFQCQKYIQLRNGETEKGPLQTVFFGGDQLTEERARNVQLARSDGRMSEERLQGLWPKNEDWHAIRIAYKVLH